MGKVSAAPWTLGLASALLLSACATAGGAHTAAEAPDARLGLCSNIELRDGVEANHCYEEWLLDHPADSRAQDIRYTTAARWIALGNPQRARDLIDDLLLHDPYHPLGRALRESLLDAIAMAEVAAADTSPTIAPPVTVETNSAHPPTAPTPARVATMPESAPLGDEPFIRMVLRNSREITLTAYDDMTIGGGNSAAIRVEAGATVRLQPRAMRESMDCGNKPICKFAVGEHLFHGRLLFVRAAGVSSWIVEMPIERYLRGVIPSEMPAGWPAEALKAQAVISRTYAYWLIRSNPDAPFHLGTTVMDQAYNNPAQSSGVEQALRTTRGQILVNGDAPIVSFFHADNGGRAESASNVWGRDETYYLTGDDPWSNQTPPWNFSMSKAELSGKLARKYLRRGEEVRRLKFFRNKSGRVNRINIVTDRRKVDVTGNDFRLLVGSTQLKSLLFDVRTAGNRYEFSGRGYGHGVGLSQHGAKAMVDAGKTYREILEFYYPGTELVPLWP